MQIGFVGLGRMGLAMSQRLLKRRHAVIGYDLLPAARKAAERIGAPAADSLKELAARLRPPRAVWLMVPAGKPTGETLGALLPFLSPGDTVVDGGNSHYSDSISRAGVLNGAGIAFLDAGTSGGPGGRENGFCLMVGGRKEAFKRLEPLFRDLAAPGGYLYAGPSGAGHFVKMVHNGIEYGLLQAYAEGFALLKAKKEFSLDLEKISRLWNHGSVIRSWLLELSEDLFRREGGLGAIRPYVADSGEGRWTAAEAAAAGVAAPVITLSLLARLRSRDRVSFSDRVIAGLRSEFGGHPLKRGAGTAAAGKKSKG